MIGVGRDWVLALSLCAVALWALGERDARLERMRWLLFHRVAQSEDDRLVPSSPARRGPRVRASVQAEHGGVLALIDELDAGATTTSALRAVAARAAPAVRLAYEEVADAVDAGAETVLATARDHRIGLAVAVALRTGCAFREVLAGVADDLAARRSVHSAVTAAVAGPKASAAVLAVLPLLGLGLGGAMGAHPIGVLVGTGAGRALFVLGVVFTCSGIVWTRRLVRSAMRA